MGAKVTGISKARSNLAALVDDIQGKKAIRSIQSAMLIGGSLAATYTPIDTSTLINSQFRDIRVNGTILTGRVGYSANYALYVHEASGALKGKPRADFGVTRAGVAFGGGTKKGNYWDPNAKPKFLQSGFEESKEQIDAVIRKEMSL